MCMKYPRDWERGGDERPFNSGYGHSLPWYPPIKCYKKSFGKGDIIGMISRSLTPIFKLCSVNLNMRASIFTCVHRLNSSTKLCMLKKYIQLLRRRKKDLHDSPSGQRWPLGPNPKWRLCLGIAHVQLENFSGHLL